MFFRKKESSPIDPWCDYTIHTEELPFGITCSQVRSVFVRDPYGDGPHVDEIRQDLRLEFPNHNTFIFGVGYPEHSYDVLSFPPVLDWREKDAWLQMSYLSGPEVIRESQAEEHKRLNSREYQRAYEDLRVSISIMWLLRFGSPIEHHRLEPSLLEAPSKAELQSVITASESK